MRCKVLFIGNSYTYFNEMPGMLAQLAASAEPIQEVAWEMVAPGGWTWEQHSGNPETLEAIDREMWTHVVLQEQSLRPVENTTLMHHFGQLLIERIQAKGAEPVLYLTWARQNTPEMQSGLTDAYKSLAARTGAIVAPVGMAWEAALQGIPGLVLHVDDGSHPNPTGSYLAACVFYGTLFGRSPEGLTATVTVPDAPDLALSHDLAARLQLLSWKAIQTVS